MTSSAGLREGTSEELSAIGPRAMARVQVLRLLETFEKDVELSAIQQAVDMGQ
ncbi:hypothetical protein AB9F26_00015 [Falsihalocynthiibacter sp. BN13B15]|uniref:hypothetical protein n=1 Tax=Falsihalocynthiibacter sp. BN13B15 TaxID=3240871 RepID=UPI0035104A44